jgi:SM-20-related protein
MTTMLDYSRIRAAEVRSEPYPFFVVEGALDRARAAEVAGAFPQIDRPGAIDVEDTKFGPQFAELLDELRGEAFRKVVADKLGVPLDGLETVVNVRGQVRSTDGNIHTDTPTKAVTVLVYFNEEDEAPGTGLRILNSNRDLDDYAAEVPARLGTMVAFKVTPDCWHGHGSFSGKRRSLQMNYLSGLERTRKHERFRRFVSHARRRLGLADR